IQETIRPERETPAVVVPVRLVDFEDDALGGWIGSGQISSGRFEFTEALGVIPFGRRVGSQRRAVDHVELVVGLELRVQRQAEESALLHAFAQCDYFSPQIKKGLLGLFPVAGEE